LSQPSRKPTSQESRAILDRHQEEEEIYFRAQGFHRAAKILVNAFEGRQAPWIDGEF
jgi:hypothetical protein